jgi:hypothetical protein
MTLRPGLVGPMEVHVFDEEGVLLKTEAFEILAGGEGKEESMDRGSHLNRLLKNSKMAQYVMVNSVQHLMKSTYWRP